MLQRTPCDLKLQISEIELPHQCHNYQNLSDPKRRFDHYVKNQNFCDHESSQQYISTDWHGPGWYRVVGGAGTQISEQSLQQPNYGTCGAHIGAWITGGHPSIPGENVIREIYQKLASSQIHNVDVTNCNGYMVYNLKGFSGCAYRYCTQ